MRTIIFKLIINKIFEAFKSEKFYSILKSNNDS